MNEARLNAMATDAVSIDLETHRVCTRCGSPGPFPADRSRADGLHIQCKECHRSRIAKNRAAFPSKYRAINRDSMRRARKANPEAARLANLKWYAKHGQNPEFRERARAASAAWYRLHPERWIVYKFQRRARKASASGHATLEQIRGRIAFFGWRCAYCRGPFEHIDHVIALSRGGTNWPANLRPACSACNLSKHTKTWKAVQL